MDNAYDATFFAGDYVNIGAMRGRSPQRVGQVAKVLGSKDKGDKVVYRLGLADEVFWTSGTGLTDATGADAPIVAGALVIIDEGFDNDNVVGHSARVTAVNTAGLAAVQITEDDADISGVYVGPVSGLISASPAPAAAPAEDAGDGVVTGCSMTDVFALGQVDTFLALAQDAEDEDTAFDYISQAREVIANAVR